MINNEGYQRAIKFVLTREGGYVNDPEDLGGETNKGITYNTYNQYRRSKSLATRSVKFITELELHEIYYNLYYKAAKCEALPERLAFCHFDWAVNHGVHGAIKTLQNVVGTVPDGIIGVNTRAAINRSLQMKGELAVCELYCNLRERMYHQFAKQGNQRKYLQGWLNRLNALRSEIFDPSKVQG